MLVRSGRYLWRFGCVCQCHPSSVVEQCFRKAQVVGSSPMGGFHYATGGALRAAPVALFQPPSASPLATRAPSADWIGRRSWSSRLVPPRRWPRRQSRRVPWVAVTTRQTFTQASSLRDIGLRGRLGLGGGVLGMTHAPGCVGTAGACRLPLAEANDDFDSARLVASTTCADDSRGSQECQRTWSWNNGEVERLTGVASHGAWCNTDLPCKTSSEG